MRSFLFASVLFVSTAANALPVRWDLVDVEMLRIIDQFTPPTIYSLSGYFIYDADLDYSERYLEVNITGGYFGDYIDGLSAVRPGPGSPLPPLSDEQSWFFDNPILYPETFALDAVYSGDYVYFEYDAPLTNAGGLVNVSGGQEFSCDPIEQCGGIGDEVGGQVLSGSLTGTVVPVPAAVWLFASCLGLLGWFSRKAKEAKEYVA